MNTKTRLTKQDNEIIALALKIAHREISEKKDSPLTSLLDEMADLYDYFYNKTQDKWTK